MNIHLCSKTCRPSMQTLMRLEALMMRDPCFNCLERQLVTRSIFIQHFSKKTHSSIANLEGVATCPKRFIIVTNACATVIRKCEKAVHHISWIQSGGFGFASCPGAEKNLAPSWMMKCLYVTDNLEPRG